VGKQKREMKKKMKFFYNSVPKNGAIGRNPEE